MNNSEFQVESGQIVAFDDKTARGQVRLSDRLVEFHSTIFQRSLPTRFPLVGENVEVTFSHGQLVSIHSAR
jgi:hypothetical protein